MQTTRALKSSRLYIGMYVHSLVVFNQEYDPRIYRHRFPKKFSKWYQTPKGSSNFGSVRVYLFVNMIITIMYIHMKTLRVSNSTWDV